MPTTKKARMNQQEQFKPLRKVLIERFEAANPPMTQKAFAEKIGLTDYQVGRIFNGTLPSPTYLDLTRIIIGLGLTPNEAARIVGLYTSSDDIASEALAPEERRIISLIRKHPLSRARREHLAQFLEDVIRGLFVHDVIDEVHAKPAGIKGASGKNPESEEGAEHPTSLYNVG